MLRGKKILVTSGGTQEYIDDVRVLTNISSGKLGSIIAERLIDVNAQVTYLHGVNAILPRCDLRKYPMIPCKVKSAQDAYSWMEKLIPDMDAVIHCMAVSDFTFKRDGALKCKSSDPQAFIDYMSRTITKNPKIISKVKEWNPKTILIGFKFEVGISNDELIELAVNSIQKNKCDLVVANDKEEMVRDKAHVAYAVTPGAITKMIGKERIAEVIGDFLTATFEAQELEL
jgi:phosphopantothenate-cysteine ligase